MKPALTIASLLVLPFATLRGQAPADLPDPGLPGPAEVPDLPAPTPDLPPSNLGDLPPPAPAPPPPGTEEVDPVVDAKGDPNAAPASPNGPASQQEITAADGGYVIKNAAMNDILQFLAKEGGKQYFHNSKIAGPEFTVTGHLNDGNPLQQMEELSFLYGLTLYTKGNTIYALTPAQLAQLPSAEYHYHLRYLRPTEVEYIKNLLSPVLSPGTGIVQYEPKTNSIIVVDTAHRIEKVQSLLHKIDQPKGQIVVETKIIRVNSTAAERMGVNWTASLGEAGVPLSVTRDLNSVFGIDSNTTANNLILSPLQVNGVLRAMSEGGFATQISNPTLITEDNEPGSISIIDRIPIITTTINQTESSNNITEQVRYKIDESDKSIADEPEKHREIGISVTITPQILPDGTIRMRMRPRSAQIAEQIKGQSGNFYPRVTESMIESLARVPDGHSLVVGGFYGEVESNGRNKVPLLGDIPIVNFFFKSRETTKENTSLVFLVTPTSYSPESRSSNARIGSGIRRNVQFPPSHDWVDPVNNPGPAHEPNLQRTLRGMQPTQAPYYPTEAELNRAQNPDSTKRNKPRFSGIRR